MTERLLELRDLRVDFTVGARRTRAVRGVDLSLDAGEVLALVGESGSGKSVTAASIIGILPERRAVATGSIVFRGQELLGLSERKLNTVRGTHLTMVFQNPLTSLDPSFTIGSQFDEVIGAHDTAPRAEARALAVRWLDNVGIRDPERVLGSYPHELSGGMRQRVVIALSALSEPSLIIADEPTTALDATIQKQVLDLLLGLRGDLGTAILIITHDFGVVAHMSDRVAVMRRGVIVEEGATAEVLAAPRHDYTKALIASVPRLGARGDELGRRRFQVVEGGVEHTPLPREAWPAREQSDASPLVVEHVTKTFGAGRGWRDRHATFTALDDVSIEARAGETLGIIGESGSGKTTLAKIIAGVQPPTSGTATVFGRDYASLRTEAERRDFRRDVQVVFQDITSSLNPRRPVIQQLVEPALRLGAASTRAEAERWAGDLVDAVGLPRTFLRRYPHELSGGQRQRVGIARALSVRPRLLILDEPTSALDVTTQAVTLNLLADLRDELDLTYVMIGHNLSVIEFFCDRVAVMSTGRIVEVVDSHDLGGRAEHEVTRALLDAVLL